MHKCQINKDSKHGLSTMPSTFFLLPNVNRFRIEHSWNDGQDTCNSLINSSFLDVKGFFSPLVYVTNSLRISLTVAQYQVQNAVLKGYILPFPSAELKVVSKYYFCFFPCLFVLVFFLQTSKCFKVSAEDVILPFIVK